MSESGVPVKKDRKKQLFKLRVMLLILQILLPFGLYFALENGEPLGSAVIAVLFVLSMGVLIWIG